MPLVGTDDICAVAFSSGEWVSWHRISIQAIPDAGKTEKLSTLDEFQTSQTGEDNSPTLDCLLSRLPL
jgi:hypothetical protein